MAHSGCPMPLFLSLGVALPVRSQMQLNLTVPSAFISLPGSWWPFSSCKLIDHNVYLLQFICSKTNSLFSCPALPRLSTTSVWLHCFLSSRSLSSFSLLVYSRALWGTLNFQPLNEWPDSDWLFAELRKLVVQPVPSLHSSPTTLACPIFLPQTTSYYPLEVSFKESSLSLPS